MKAAVITLITTLTISVTWAQDLSQRWIRTPEGQIALQTTPCPQGGNEATFIANPHGLGAGAYGCWRIQGDKIVIVWHTLMGVNGSALKANFTQTFPNQ